jgi:hypothetical protein
MVNHFFVVFLCGGSAVLFEFIDVIFCIVTVNHLMYFCVVVV